MSEIPPQAATSPGADPHELAEEVAELSRLNDQIAQLCDERARALCRAGDAQRMRAVLAAAGLPHSTSMAMISVAALLPMFRELDSATLALVHRMRVGYLGPEFSYSHLAAIAQFGHGVELIPIASIGGVFEAVNRGDTAYGLVPIENSTDGRIVDTLDMFAKLPVKICGEIPMPIHHNLLGIGRMSDIEEVQSKPQALSQCRNWLARNLPKARLVASSSTTAAAEAAAQDASIAAVASQQAGINYGLSVIAENIEDSADNVTRFAVIGLEPAARTGRDKTSLMFELAHAPGALADAMNIFKLNQLNLTWIESFPKKGSQNEYLFFVELEGHNEDPAVRQAIDELSHAAVRVEILGSYPRVGQVSKSPSL